jgi:hypothetical protein
MSTEPGSDPIGDFQRWLMRAGARSIGRDVAGRVRSTLNGATGRGTPAADVWETATTEELTEEPPECQWCPICRAARRYRDSGGVGAPPGGQLAGVSDTLAGLTRDAFSLFDSAVRASQRPASPPRPTPTPWNAAPQAQAPQAQAPQAQAPQAAEPPQAADQPVGSPNPDHGHPDHGHPDHGHPDHGHSDHGTVIVGTGVGWPAVVHPEHQDHEAADERGDREEVLHAREGGADGGADQQVERPAE